MGVYRKAIEYHEKKLIIAKEVCDWAGEGGALGNYVAYQSLSDYGKAIEHYVKRLKITKEIGYQGGEGGVYGNLGTAYN